MKASILFLALASLFLSVSAQPLGEKAIIARRQVDTAAIRAGTRRLRARQSTTSTVPVISTGAFVACPDLSPSNSGFSRLSLPCCAIAILNMSTETQENVTKYAAESTTNQNQSSCVYSRRVSYDREDVRFASGPLFHCLK